MSLYRAVDRYEHDESMLVIRDPDEFRLFREREALKFRGLLYEFQPAAGLPSIIQEFSRKAVWHRKHKAPYAFQAKVIFSFSPIDQSGRQACIENLVDQHIPSEIIDAVLDTITCRRLAFNKNSGDFRIRVNSEFPECLYAHDHSGEGPFMTMALNREGTAIYPGNGKNAYILPAWMLAAMDENVRHYVETFDPHSEDYFNNPRVNFVL